MEEGRGVGRTALQWLNKKCNNDMLRRGNAMHFERLCDLPSAYDEGLGETALTRWRVETICDEKGVFGELGTPRDNGRHQCGMQRLICAR